MKTAFKDHFSDKSGEYSRFRPSYPAELFSFISSVCKGHDLAWDCATGSGQAAVELSKYFHSVIATDASRAQIEHAQSRSNISYRTEAAEKTSIDTGTVDVVTVAQALHWLDLDAFEIELERVLKPGGIVAVWSYSLLEMSPAIDKLVNYLYGCVLDEYWPEERRMVENAYRDVGFSFREIETPGFKMTAEWKLDDLIGYLKTWSAVKKYEKEKRINPVDDIAGRLEQAWGEKSHSRKVSWPLSERAWIKL